MGSTIFCGSRVSHADCVAGVSVSVCVCIEINLYETRNRLQNPALILFVT